MGATQSHERLGRTEPGPAHLPARGAGESAELIADRYRLLARIHAGSAGVLYRAEDIAFARPVALRLLTPALSRDEAVLQRLQARLRASATMAREDIGASGDIIDLTDLGRADSGQVFVVTDFLAGDNLAALIARDGPLPWRALRPLMVRACQILHLSHQHGVLRLDLQTRHLFPVRDKTQTSTLKILSPGIGDVFGDSLWSSLDPVVAAAHLRYAAPEQLTGGSLDARTDVYALGIIMYELLGGRVPFPDARPAYVCARHLLEPPPPFPPTVRAEVPDAVVGIVSRALAKTPDERWPTMRALANAMAAIDFGPCDASGVLEVAAVEPMAPNTSSASMRIDPAAGHAPSPVRPRTIPPRDGLMAEPGLGAPIPLTAPPREGPGSPTAAPREPVPTSGGGPDSQPRPTHGALDPRKSVPSTSSAIDQRAQTYERWFTGPTEASASTSGSSSRMAWDEILAAAEEAVAAVASGQGSGTAGDSGVFIPESLLRSGLAATASMANGRRPPPELDPGLSLAATVVMPTTLLRDATATAAALPDTTGLLGEDALGSDAGLAAESAEDLSRRRDEPVTATSLAPAAEESATSLRELAARSASVWPAAARSGPHPRSSRVRPMTWAAAALLAFGGTVAGLRLLRPRSAEAPIAHVAAPKPGVLPSATAPGGPNATTTPAASAFVPTDSGFAPGVDAAPNLTFETGAPAPADAAPNLAPGTGALGPAGPATSATALPLPTAPVTTLAPVPAAPPTSAPPLTPDPATAPGAHALAPSPAAPVPASTHAQTPGASSSARARASGTGTATGPSARPGARLSPGTGDTSSTGLASTRPTPTAPGPADPSPGNPPEKPALPSTSPAAPNLSPETAPPSPAAPDPAPTNAPADRAAPAPRPDTTAPPTGPRKTPPGARLPDAGRDALDPPDADPSRAPTGHEHTGQTPGDAAAGAPRRLGRPA